MRPFSANYVVSLLEKLSAERVSEGYRVLQDSQLYQVRGASK
jgi:hypothetical protein